ncbi:extracellular solute-binding protein [Demequina maris]|uniref:extracellular solute-binding protein n=1 Tax=Demequina maris TaxID=1638982 RepID=UPI000785714D|nr:extracellular solute-binding protein [Demequina maris]
MFKYKRWAGPVVGVVGISLLAACSSGSDADTSSSVGGTEPVTIEWWHIQTQEPQRSVWQQIADSFTADHPGVEIEITVQNDADFKTALDARVQAQDVPDIFQTWGGGVLQNQVDAGAVQDITDATSSWIGNLTPAAVSVTNVDGVQYGVPYDAGLVGFWYNKALFAEAGIDAPPTTWDEFTADIQKLKDSGTTPIALGAADKWPAMFYWAELALASGGIDVMDQAAVDGDFTGPAFVDAGDQIVDLVDMGAFQDGFLGAAYADASGQASLVANGKAAMELMGSWAPGTQASVAGNGEGLGDDLGWFPFPGVTDVGFGGVNSFAVGADAPAEAVEFLEYLANDENQRLIGAAGQLLPVNPAAQDSIENPLQLAIAQEFANVDRLQIYLDQAFAPAVATAINDNVQAIFAKTLSPTDAAAAITAAGQN